MIKYIAETYSADAEYLWLKNPNYAVFRHPNNRKWFAAILDIPKSKLGINQDGIVDIINLKCDPILVGSLRNEAGFFPAYHMSKASWISVALDGSADDEKIKWLLDLSFDLTAKKSKKPIDKKPD